MVEGIGGSQAFAAEYSALVRKKAMDVAKTQGNMTLELLESSLSSNENDSKGFDIRA